MYLFKTLSFILPYFSICVWTVQNGSLKYKDLKSNTKVSFCLFKQNIFVKEIKQKHIFKFTIFVRLFPFTWVIKFFFSDLIINKARSSIFLLPFSLISFLQFDFYILWYAYHNKLYKQLTDVIRNSAFIYFCFTFLSYRILKEKSALKKVSSMKKEKETLQGSSQKI